MISFLPRKAQPSVASLLLLCAAVFGVVTFWSATTSAADTVDINLADATTLSSVLIGIGPKKAQAIVDYRDQYGTFLSIDELQNVPGIGSAIFERVRNQISIDGSGDQTDDQSSDGLEPEVQSIDG